MPALYLDTGTDFIGRPPGLGHGSRSSSRTDENYHQPSDEIRRHWNFDGMIEDALLGFWTGLAIANADEMPTWKPGDEFEAARKKALETAAQ